MAHERGLGRAASAEAGEAASSRIRGAVETRLLALGCRDLRVLTDLSTANLDEPVTVQVECRRDGMPVKGRVVARNGAVVDVDLQTVAQSFP